MKLFFKDIASLHQFSISLDLHQDQTHCKHCLKKNQLVSHGFVYKKQITAEATQVGKRLLCSNRHGKSGCGRTIRLYVSSEIPTLQYGASHLCIFIYSLISNLTIQKSYESATGCKDPRNSYRWICKLWVKVIEYRQFLRTPPSGASPSIRFRTTRFQKLLPSMECLFSKLPEHPCSEFQLMTQSNFV